MSVSRAMGAALALALALVVREKLRAGQAADLLWMCYPAAALLCAGLLLGRPRLASAGGLFYLAVGLPFWLIDVITTGSTGFASLLVHLIAPVAGLVHIRQAGVPSSAKWWAVAAYFALSAICRAFTPASLNINLVFGPYFPIPIPAWAAWVLDCFAGVALLSVGEVVLNRSSGKNARPARR